MDSIVNDIKAWYFGYFTEIIQEEERFVFEHSDRVDRGNDLWRFPIVEDVCEVDISYKSCQSTKI